MKDEIAENNKNNEWVKVNITKQKVQKRVSYKKP